ncbi:hypothetical protein MKW92_029545, partial [Papaver armeniacum]
IVMHSATKFISGHADVMAGVLVVKGESLAKEIAFLQNAEGAVLENAQKIAEYLASNPRVKKVNYAGLPADHPGRSLHYSQAKGAGSVLSFVTGSVKSLISLPCFMSHSIIPDADREARGLTEDLIRISVGIEDVNDLIDDLDMRLELDLYRNCRPYFDVLLFDL